jgi:hypothetical protein
MAKQVMSSGLVLFVDDGDEGGTVDGGREWDSGVSPGHREQSLTVLARVSADPSSSTVSRRTSASPFG